MKVNITYTNRLAETESFKSLRQISVSFTNTA